MEYKLFSIYVCQTVLETLSDSIHMSKDDKKCPKISVNIHVPCTLCILHTLQLSAPLYTNASCILLHPVYHSAPCTPCIHVYLVPSVLCTLLHPLHLSASCTPVYPVSINLYGIGCSSTPILHF